MVLTRAQVCALGFQLLLGQPPLADVHHHRHDVIDAAIGFQAHMADGCACTTTWPSRWMKRLSIP